MNLFLFSFPPSSLPLTLNSYSADWIWLGEKKRKNPWAILVAREMERERKMIWREREGEMKRREREWGKNDDRSSLFGLEKCWNVILQSFLSLPTPFEMGGNFERIFHPQFFSLSFCLLLYSFNSLSFRLAHLRVEWTLTVTCSDANSASSLSLTLTLSLLFVSQTILLNR